MSEPHIIKKISVKTVCKGRPEIPKDGTNWVMEVFGIATGVRSGDSNFGPWQSLRGAFQAMNIQSGEFFRSGECFLPNVALNLVIPQLEAKDVSSIEFGFRIGVVKAETVTGYEYVCAPLLNPAENDPLLMLEKKMAEHKALPSPEGESKGKKK